MPTILNAARTADDDDPMDRLADLIDRGGENADGEVRIRIEGAYAPGALPARRSGERLEAALGDLRRRGGWLRCVTDGIAGGATLEIALLADQHLMEEEAALVPWGSGDPYVPRAGGLSRLITRSGPARAATLLLAGTPGGSLPAPACLAAGLCDGITAEGKVEPGGWRTSLRNSSEVALRLARELADRNARWGGLTGRQARLLERASFALAFATDHPREGIVAFFENRPARFR